MNENGIPNATHKDNLRLRKVLKQNILKTILLLDCNSKCQFVDPISRQIETVNAFENLL